MLQIIRVLAFVLIHLVLAGTAQAGKRVALVIGNGGYAQVPRLENPVRDATAVADSLKRLAFDEVILRTDLDYAGFRRAMVDFTRVADGADIAVVYYAGHGIEIGGRNYLIPVDAGLQDVRDADFEAMPLDLAMATLGGAKQLRVVILDACRDNPFGVRLARTDASRSIGRGLARVDAPSNTLVAYAAKEGTTAADGDEQHSPFTSALLEEIEKPGVEVRLMFGRVRDAVLRRTGNRQEPFVYGAVGGSEIFLKPAAPPVAAPASSAGPSQEMEALFWNTVKDSKDAALLQSYLDRFPDGVFTGLARVMIDRLETAAPPPQQARTAMVSPAVTTAEATPSTAEEMLALAERYETGRGVTRNMVEAVRLYRAAAGRNLPAAMLKLGHLLLRGDGVARSPDEAAIQMLEAVRVHYSPAVAALTEDPGLREAAFVEAIQRRLNGLGHYRGKVDGKWGTETRKAILAHAGRVDDEERAGGSASEKKVTPNMAPPREPERKPAAERPAESAECARIREFCRLRSGSPRCLLSGEFARKLVQDCGQRSAGSVASTDNPGQSGTELSTATVAQCEQHRRYCHLNPLSNPCTWGERRRMLDTVCAGRGSRAATAKGAPVLGSGATKGVCIRGRGGSSGC